MATVFFGKQFTNRVHQLCEAKDKNTGKSIFQTNLDFMIFAAMVGRNVNSSCAGVKIEKSSKGIKDSTFSAGHKDGYAFLLALEGANNGNILRDGNENELYKYIESYAFLGCQEIEKWISDRPNDELHEIILDKIMHAAEPLSFKGSSSKEIPDIDI
jgi:dnd system-associated protein 4